MIANVALVAVSVVVGWAALFPARRSLGAPLYHLSALPVGVMGWSFMAALCTYAGVRPAPLWAFAGLAAFVVVVAALAFALRGEGVSQVTWRSFALFGGAAMALSAVLAYAGLTMVGFDSYSHYELSAWYLFDTGHISDVIISSRNVLVPAYHVGTRLFGADWTYVIYPVFSANTLALLAWALWSHAFAALAPLRRAGAVALTCLAMAVVPAWVFHTWFVHSNLVSALYLTLAAVATLAACGALAVTGREGRIGPEAAMLVAGLALAGLGLARPDGLAYTFAGLALIAVCHGAGLIRARAVVAGYASLLVTSVAVYGAAFHALGMWKGTEKLEGKWVAALLGAVAVFGVVTLLSRKLRLPRWILSDPTLIGVAVTLNVMLLAFVAREQREEFVAALRNMGTNLFVASGWGIAWTALLFATIVSLLFPLPGSRWRWRRLLLYSVFQFFAIAAVVHGMVHPGRINIMDSFNRVAVHVLPLAFWYVASYVGDLFTGGAEPASPPLPEPESAEQAAA